MNKWALRLQSGLELPGVAGPTNNLDGWQTYGAVFREAAEVVGISSGELAVRLPDDYPPSQREFDLRMGESIPDLRAGLTSLRDVLVALEWLQVEFIEHLADKKGDFLVIDCRRLTKKEWEDAEEISMYRGLAAMRARLPIPIWTIQPAGQDVETWPQMGEFPIFTEHTDAQFGWMRQCSFDRQDAQRKLCGEV